VLVLVRHASKSYQKKFTTPLTVRAPVRGLQVDAPKNYWKGKQHEIENSNHNHRPLTQLVTLASFVILALPELGSDLGVGL
jgi:hypothetical protein